MIAFFAVVSLVGCAKSVDTNPPTRTELKDEHVVMLGDSNTWIGGDDCSKPAGWNYWFVKLAAPASAHSYARSGATWTATPCTRRDVKENVGVISDNNVIYNQVARLQEAVKSGYQPVPTLVFISAGANDAWFSRRRPRALKDSSCSSYSESPASAMTLPDAVKQTCGMLKKEFPDVRIVVLVPFPMKSVKTESMERASRLISETAREVGAEVIFQKESGVGYGTSGEPSTSDGNHTNLHGAEILGRFIYDKLKGGES